MAEAAVDGRRSGTVFFACLFAWLVPGAGHLYLRRTARGLVFLGAIGALFALGVVMDARLQTFTPWVDLFRHGRLDDPLGLLRGIAQMAIGLPYFLAPAVAKAAGFEMGTVTSVLHEYGNTFTEVGGLLNVLVILDAHDVAVGRKK